MRGQSDGPQKKCLVACVCIVVIFMVILYVFYDSKNSGESALEYGSCSLRKLGSSYLGVDKEQDELWVKFDIEDGISPWSFPVCDVRHSELIPCLDRDLMYQTRLKLYTNDTTHYLNIDPNWVTDHKVEMKFGKQTFLTRTLHPEGEPTSITELTNTLHRWKIKVSSSENLAMVRFLELTYFGFHVANLLHEASNAVALATRVQVDLLQLCSNNTRLLMSSRRSSEDIWQGEL